MKAIWITLAALLALLVGACDESPNAGSPENDPASTEGQGEEVSTDPHFTIKLKIADSAELTFAPRQFAIYQSKPPKENDKEQPQGFEVRGEKFVVAGRAPDDVKVAPGKKFAMLVGKSLTARPRGGDPTNVSMSKITTPDDKTYVVSSGTVTIERVFHRTGQYAGVSGKMDLKLQQIKLGDPDDPNNKGDQPIGEPVPATGEFTARADSYPYESL